MAPQRLTQSDLLRRRVIATTSKLLAAWFSRIIDGFWLGVGLAAGLKLALHLLAG